MEDYLSEDIETLLKNPDMEMGFAYNDSGSCWKLINELIKRLRKSLEDKEKMTGIHQELSKCLNIKDPREGDFAQIHMAIIWLQRKQLEAEEVMKIDTGVK